MAKKQIDILMHEALIDCGHRCQGILKNRTLLRKEIKCDEVHGKPAKHYKGRVILVTNFISKKKGYIVGNLKMLCLKCSNESDAEKRRKIILKAPEINENQLDLFSLPNQNKYSGPKRVPETSISAYNESGTTRGMETGTRKTYNLVRKSPGRTAYELFRMTSDFSTIYDLRRYLSDLKKDNFLFNPEERKCRVKKRMMYTWRLM